MIMIKYTKVPKKDSRKSRRARGIGLGGLARLEKLALIQMKFDFQPLFYEY